MRLLLVEDDADVRAVMQLIFDDAGYEMDIAETVEVGLQFLSDHDYEVVVTDGRLQDGTGMQIADAATKRDIPALIVTGYAFDLQDEAPVDGQRYNVLQKPWRPAELIDAIEELLQRGG